MNIFDSKHPIYRSWQHMKARCDTPTDAKYFLYGGRGITYCNRWTVFNNFAEDMASGWKEGLTLNRINNNDNYYKENCNWATQAEQQRNRSNNKITIEIAREIRALHAARPPGAVKFYFQTELAEYYGVSRRMIDYIATGKSWGE